MNPPKTTTMDAERLATLPWWGWRIMHRRNGARQYTVLLAPSRRHARLFAPRHSVGAAMEMGLPYGSTFQ